MTESPPAGHLALAPDVLLAANLAALRQTQPSLHERVHWPVDGEHLFQDAAGAWTYRYRGAHFPFALDIETIAPLFDGIEPDTERELFLFGLGLGETLREALRRFPRARLLAWDRDPWVLRQVLCSHDWSEALTSGRLRFALGVDLVSHLEGAARWPVVWHPLLARVYTNERVLMEEGPLARRALVCVGDLFVDSLADALRAEGYSVYSFDAGRLALEELVHTVDTFGPELLFSIDHVNGLAEFCADRDLDYLCWEIDPATEVPQPLTRPAPRARVFTYREAHVADYRRAGFEHVEYLPLAADPERRRPIELSGQEREHYAAPLSFVGASLMGCVGAYQRTFLEQVEAHQPGSRALGQGVLYEVVRTQREDLSSFRVPELLERCLPGLRERCRAGGQEDPALLVGEICAAEKRLNYLAELAEHGAEVWGDDGWRQLEAHGVRYRGPALHEHDLPRIYSASTINIDVGRLYQSDIVTMRIFDILACGGFVLAEHSQALGELFEVGVEVESYRTLEELREKVARYLAQPDEARAIAERGRRAVLQRHRISQRVQTMLARSGHSPG